MGGGTQGTEGETGKREKKGTEGRTSTHMHSFTYREGRKAGRKEDRQGTQRMKRNRDKRKKEKKQQKAGGQRRREEDLNEREEDEMGVEEGWRSIVQPFPSLHSLSLSFGSYGTFEENCLKSFISLSLSVSCRPPLYFWVI